MSRFTALALCLALQAMPAVAQEAAAEQDIVVVGATKVYRLTARELHAGVEAFRRNRARYAPHSALWLEVAPRRAGGSIAGVELALVNATSRIALPIGADGRFPYPDVAGEDWRLVTTRPGVMLRISPWVVSPGTTAADMRLGDLQVQCRVGWAMERQSASFLLAGMFDAMGGCASSRLALYQEFGRRIAAATIEQGDRRAPIPTWHDTALRMPTYLKGYGDEARVRLQFR